MINKIHKIMTPALTFGSFFLLVYMVLHMGKYSIEALQMIFFLNLIWATSWGGGKAEENVIEKFKGGV